MLGSLLHFSKSYSLAEFAQRKFHGCSCSSYASYSCTSSIIACVKASASQAGLGLLGTACLNTLRGCNNDEQTLTNGAVSSTCIAIIPAKFAKGFSMVAQVPYERSNPSYLRRTRIRDARVRNAPASLFTMLPPYLYCPARCSTLRL